MNWAKGFEQIADEIAGIILIVGGIYLITIGTKSEGMALVNLGAMYLFYRRTNKSKITNSRGLPYGHDG